MIANTNELLDDIHSSLDIASISYSGSSEAHDVYEGFVFALVVRVAIERGATVYFEDVTGERTGNLVFRTSPGRLHSRAQPYTHAVIEFDGTPELEVHVGVYVLGASGVMHECDVVVLERGEASECRRSGTLPRSQRCLLAIECKFYAAAIPLGQARGFVGLGADLSRNTMKLFVTNTGSTSVARYLEKRNAGWEHQVLPGAPQTEALRAEIRKAFRSHVTRHNPALRI